jgi:hypothetical protein
MEYQEYARLGFKRHELSCSVEFRQTGYYGFVLSKKINKRQSIEVTSGELDKPKLYIKKKDSDTYHIIPITPDAVIDLLEKNTQDSRNLK